MNRDIKTEHQMVPTANKMNISIIHAIGDKSFVAQLAIQLSHEIDCGITLLEMPEGDSDFDKDKYENIEIDATIILLSENFTATQLCQQFTAATFQEFEDQGLAVIRVMIQDCEIPEFAQREWIADFRGATPEETSAIGEYILWISSWRRAIAEHFHQEILSGKSPEDCRPQRIPLPARIRLERNDFFNRTFFPKRLIC